MDRADNPFERPTTSSAIDSGRGSELAEQSHITAPSSNMFDEPEDPLLYPVPSIAPFAPAAQTNHMYPHIFPNNANAAAVQKSMKTANVSTPVHTPKDPEALYSPDHKKEREDRQARRDYLRKFRETVDKIPCSHYWEVCVHLLGRLGLARGCNGCDTSHTFAQSLTR